MFTGRHIFKGVGGRAEQGEVLMGNLVPLGPLPSELFQMEARGRASGPSIGGHCRRPVPEGVQVGWGGSPRLGAVTREGCSSEPIFPAVGWARWL